jgi:hypothetical protein
MPMFSVADDEVQKILAMKVPKHPKARFDDADFLDLVARSYSIEYREKVWIVENVARSPQGDIDSLLTMLRAERKGFEGINRRYDAAIEASLSVN